LGLNTKYPYFSLDGENINNMVKHNKVHNHPWISPIGISLPTTNFGLIDIQPQQTYA
jgi:hypothetical protein